jgi:copper ion binding protein
MSTTVHRVTGMTCGHCVSAVEKEVGAIAGVTEVHVELTTGDVTVSSDRPLDRDELAAAIDEAGYELAG